MIICYQINFTERFSFQIYEVPLPQIDELSFFVMVSSLSSPRLELGVVAGHEPRVHDELERRQPLRRIWTRRPRGGPVRAIFEAKRDRRVWAWRSRRRYAVTAGIGADGAGRRPTRDNSLLLSCFFLSFDFFRVPEPTFSFGWLAVWA